MIWKRYFLKELTSVFLLFLILCFFLFVLIDYSSHSKLFHQNGGIHLFSIIFYYLSQFSQFAEIFIPIGLMLATIKVVSSANVRNESLALTVGGIGLKKLLSPFIYVGIGCMLLIYINFQFIQPKAYAYMTHFEEDHFVKKGRKENQERVYSLMLTDQSFLVYGSFDTQKKILYDVFWIKNLDEIYHICALDCTGEKPIGDEVDLLLRGCDNKLVRKNHLKNHKLSLLPLESDSFSNLFLPPKWQSLLQLYRNLRACKILEMNDKEASVATHFFYKLTIPLGALLAIIGPAPFCLRSHRKLPIFLIYSLALFGIITFFTLQSASVILGESQIITPLVAVLTPVLLFSFIFGWKYAKL